MSITAILYFLSLDGTEAALLVWFSAGPHLFGVLTSTSVPRLAFTTASDQLAAVLVQAPGVAGFAATDEAGFSAYSAAAAQIVSHISAGLTEPTPL